MKLLPEHSHNVTPYLREGVLILLLNGHVVFATASENIIRDVVEIQEKGHICFDAFAYIMDMQERSEWMVKQLDNIYNL